MTVQLEIPEAALEMIEAAAIGYGWQPTITNNQGEPVQNPQSAIERILVEAISNIRSVAINTIAQRKAEVARAQTVEELTAITSAWIESLGAT